MIIIKAKRKGKGVKVAITIAGPGKDVADEAAAIVIQLPKRLAEIDAEVFHSFTEGVKATIDEEFAPNEEDDDNAEPMEG